MSQKKESDVILSTQVPVFLSDKVWNVYADVRSSGIGDGGGDGGEYSIRTKILLINADSLGLCVLSLTSHVLNCNRQITRAWMLTNFRFCAMM